MIRGSTGRPGQSTYFVEGPSSPRHSALGRRLRLGTEVLTDRETLRGASDGKGIDGGTASREGF